MTQEVIAENPTTGERVAFRNGAWVPISGQQAAPLRQSRQQQQPRRPQIRFADDDDAIIRTVIGEARGEDARGRQAVAAVIRNRARARGKTPAEVVLEQNQFEPWGNPETASNLMAIQPTDPLYQEIAQQIASGEDPTGGASHFYAPKAQAALGRPAPAWDDGSGFDIGNHRFFRLEGGAQHVGAPAGETEALEVVGEFPANEGVEAVNPETGERARLVEGQWVKVDDNGFLIDTEGRWGTEEHPYDVQTLGLAIEDGTAKQGDVVRYRNEDGETWLGQFRGMGEGKNRIDQGGNVFVSETGLGQNLGAAVLAANEQIPFGQDLLAGSNALLTGRAYGEARQSLRDLKEADRATDQGARNVGGVAGFGATMLLPTAGAGWVANAGTKAEKAGRLGLLGMGSGAIYGFGTEDGNLGERLQAGATDALIGGGLSMAAPYAAPIAKAAVKGAAEAPARVASGLSEVGSTIARATGREAPEANISAGNTRSAAKYVEGLIRRSGAEPLQDARGLLNRPVTLAEAIGPSGVATAAALGRRTGRTGNELVAQLGARADDAPARVLSDFEEVTGVAPASGREVIERLAREGRERAAPLYSEAYAMPAALTDNLAAILRTPSGKAALNQAARIAGDEMRDPAALGFATDAAGDVVEVAAPTIQTLDYIKRGLDAVLDGSRNPVTGKLQLDTKTRPVVGLAERLRAEIIEQTGGEVGPYARALAEAGDAIRLEQAIDQAPRLFSQAVTGRQFAERIEKMGEGERRALVAGFGERLMTDAASGRLTVAALNRLDVPATREKLGSLIGEGAASDLFARIRAEVELGRTGARMMPNTNSVTGEIGQANRELDGDGLAERAVDSVRRGGLLSAVTEAAVAPVKAFVRGASTPATQATRDEIGRLLMMAPQEAMEEINRVLSFDQTSRGLLSPSQPSGEGLLATRRGTSAAERERAQRRMQERRERRRRQQNG